MAPEQVEGKDVTVRADVYSLGAVLYEALAGRPPHTAASVAELYAKITRDDPEPPSRARPGVPVELERVCLKALARDAGERYAAAAAFADELGRFLRGEPVEARPLPWPARLGRRLMRHRVAAGIAALALGVAGAWAAQRLAASAELRRVTSAAGRDEREGRLDDARRGYQEALRLDPAHAGARAALEGVEREIGRSRAKALSLLEAARPKLEEARRVLYEPGGAVDRLGALLGQVDPLVAEALARAPDLALAQYRSGERWELRGRIEEAEAAWKRAAELDPAFGAARYQRGRALLSRAYLASLDFIMEEKGKIRAEGERLTREALADIEAAGRLESGFDPDFQRAMAAAMAAYLRGDRPEAARLCREGASRFGRREGSEEFDWLEGLAAEGPEEKRKAFDGAIRRRPGFPLALFSRARARVLAGDMDGARSDLDAALRWSPAFAEALLERASVRYAMKDAEGAFADYEGVLALGRLQAGAYTGRGNCWRAFRGDLTSALRDFTRAIELVPEHYYLPYMGRAEVRFALGDWAGCVSDCDRALAITDHGLARRLKAEATAKLEAARAGK
jgi:tetratricopeptide (TPR) repeat protein